MVSLISLVSFGQISLSSPTETITIGKVGGGMGPFIASLEYSKGDNQNQYMLSYNDATYTTLTSINRIKFSGNEELIETFYQMLNDLISGDAGVEKEFNIGKEVMSVKCIKNLGVKSLQIITSDRGTAGYFYVTKKQLDKLFGKL